VKNFSWNKFDQKIKKTKGGLYTKKTALVFLSKSVPLQKRGKTREAVNVLIKTMN